MKTSEILELVRAGYTKAEIQAMDAATAAAPMPAAEPAAEPADEAPAAPAADPVPSVEPASATPDWQQQLFTQLGALTAAIQGQNRAQAEMGAQIIEPYAAGVNTLRGLVNIPNKEDK